jgi:hypothetical protein
MPPYSSIEYFTQKTMSTPKTFACHKMIRSKDADFMHQHQITAQTKPISPDQKEAWIKKKLIGEANEVSSAKTHAKSLSELIDVQEAIFALLDVWKISHDGFAKMCQEKRDLRGCYTNGVFLTSITLDTDNPLYAHYTDHPEKFTPVS